MSWGVAILYVNFLNSSILLIVLLELLTIIFSIKGANHKIIALSVDNISYLRPAGGEESGEEGEVGFYFLSDLENKHKYISFSFSNNFI